jgi:hypothetical protein
MKLGFLGNLNRSKIFANIDSRLLSWLFIVWVIYLSSVQTIGFFYNFEWLSKFFVPSLLVTAILVLLFAFKLVKSLLLDTDGIAKAIFVVWLIFIVYVLKISFIYPDYSWDGQAYHLPSSVEWAKTSKVGLVYISLYSSSYPGLSELLQALWFKTTHIYGPPHNISQICGFFILALSAVGIAKKFTKSPSKNMSVLIFTSTIPGVVLQSTVAYNDLFFSSLIVLTVYFVLSFYESKGNGKLLYLYAGAGSAGLVASTKFTGVYFAFIALAVFTIFFVVQRNIKLLMLLPAYAITLFASFIWYYKNWLYFRNPLYPLTTELGPVTLFSGPLANPDVAFFDYFASSLGIPNNPFGVVASWFWWPIWRPVYDTRIGGYGLAWLLIFIFSIVFFGYKYIKDRNFSYANFNKAQLCLLLFSFVSVFIVPAGWWTRYVLFFPVLVGLIIILKLNMENLRIRNLLYFALVATILESSVYLSFNAGTPFTDPKFYGYPNVPSKITAASLYTGLDTARHNVYQSVAPDLRALSTAPGSKVYLNEPGQLYFPLYGINFQHTVYPAFTRDVEPGYGTVPQYTSVSNSKELVVRMQSDNQASILVTQNREFFDNFLQLNKSCKDLSLSKARTFIATCA